MAIVQDPSEALAPSMPLSAIEHVHVDAVRPPRRSRRCSSSWRSSTHPAMTSGNGARGDAAEAADAREPAG